MGALLEEGKEAGSNAEAVCQWHPQQDTASMEPMASGTMCG